jgi:hypothetical protein
LLIFTKVIKLGIARFIYGVINLLAKGESSDKLKIHTNPSFECYFKIFANVLNNRAMVVAEKVVSSPLL